MRKTNEIVKERREQLGLSQDELARRVGYTNRSSIARIERGDTDIPQSKLYDIARALRVTPSYLMGEESQYVFEHNHSDNTGHHRTIIDSGLTVGFSRLAC